MQNVYKVGLTEQNMKSVKALKKEIIMIEAVLLNPILTDYKRKRAKEDIQRLKKEIKELEA